MSTENKLVEMSTIKAAAILAMSILFGSFAQISLKIGVRDVGFTFATILSTKIFNIYIVSGILLYILAMATWMLVLTTADMSFLYPFLALGDIVVVLLSIVILGEYVSGLRWAGILLVVSGVTLVSRTRPQT